MLGSSLPVLHRSLAHAEVAQDDLECRERQRQLDGLGRRARLRQLDGLGRRELRLRRAGRRRAALLRRGAAPALGLLATDGGLVTASRLLAVVSAGVGEGTLAAVTALAEARDLGPLDCLRPTLEALLAGAADGAAPKKARLAASKAALGGAAALIGGLGSGAVAQVALLAALQACCEASPPLAEVFEHVLLQLYELDGELLPEEAIFAWRQKKTTAVAIEPDADARFLEKAKAFIAWLEEASSSEEEDSD